MRVVDVESIDVLERGFLVDTLAYIPEICEFARRK